MSLNFSLQDLVKFRALPKKSNDCRTTQQYLSAISVRIQWTGHDFDSADEYASRVFITEAPCDQRNQAQHSAAARRRYSVSQLPTDQLAHLKSAAVLLHPLIRGNAPIAR
ncbi:hypothetical protein AN931_07980 [Mycobacterium intracellulare subsp. chimaera]|nr:hypothetical protein AN480_09130 [Mycobacterium intracellulare subsp. chimaera]ARV81646.1 hypothetical protein BWK49_10335 [Mycobacterium intracellulare subsp. chimaera]KPN52932.1 hypothetical protein AN932_07555 [Mycobacterium intracellulare subsp. chimaera]KPN57571.1 hypothetical protein AN933_07585 [Mycobacterium intracellulare subsp. chimaera]KPN58951.1 hypothetical protein AN931_07980 [Mycobacterium intracellulare subsp. chimaera]